MIGVLEGVFAMGQVYVLVSRVTDPRNFLLCGLPPKDIWEDASEAWARAGLNVADCWKRACSVTNEWVYDHQPDRPLKARIQQRLISERGIPLKNRTLAETLDPQPEASAVYKRLLDSRWEKETPRAGFVGRGLRVGFACFPRIGSTVLILHHSKAKPSPFSRPRRERRYSRKAMTPGG